MENLNILVDSDLFAITPQNQTGEANQTKAIIHKLYKRSTASELVSEKAGLWFEEQGYANVLTNTVQANRRKNLFGTVLKSCIVITHNGSLKHLTDKREKHIDTIAKVNYIFMLHLSDMFNATIEFSVQSTWGYKDKNNSWSGMIGELTRQEADIGGTPLFLTTDRIAIIDYIAMTTPTKSKFVFRQPKLSYITNVFTLPFDNQVWVSSIVMVLILAVALYTVVSWEWKRKRLAKTVEFKSDPELRNNFLDVLLLAFGAMCQQGSHVVPYTTSGRIITIVLFISLMFLYTSYSANIVALLQSSSTSIQTLQDLLSSRLQVGVDDTVFNHFYFPVSFCWSKLKFK